MRGGICGLDRRTNRFLDCKVTTCNIVFIEYLLFDDIGRAFIPVRIVVVQPDRQDGSGTDIGTTPPPRAIHESQADMKLRVFHGSSFRR